MKVESIGRREGIMMRPGYFGGYGMGGGSLMMLLIVLVIGVLLYVAFNQNRKKSQSGSNEALDVAKGRLARGEITTEEYEQIKEKLL